MTTQFQFTPPGTNVAAYGVKFQSLTELADWTQAHHDAGTHVPCGWSRRDCPQTAQAEKRIHTGANDMVPYSEKIMALIEAQSPMGLGQMGSVRAVAGGMPDVPAFLAGTPVNMRQRRRRDAMASLRIVVNVASSAGISDQLLERRGAATLALLRLLETAGHPVELWVMHGFASYAKHLRGGGFSFVRLDTQPIDLARAAWALGSTEFSRHVMYNANTTHTKDESLSPWPWEARGWATSQRLQAESAACALGMDMSDLIYLPAVYMDSAKDFKNDANAAAWVNATYAKATKTYITDAA